MAELTLIEFGVYGFFSYLGMLMLIISVVKEVPDQKPQALIRSVFLIPCIIASFLLAFFIPDVVLWDTTNVIINLNTTEVYNETIQHRVSLINPVWVLFHFMLGVVMVIYIIQQALTILTKT